MRAPPSKMRKPKEVYYVLPIDRWEWAYTFGLNILPALSDNVYSDHRHLVIHGTLTVPTSAVSKAVQLTFVPSPRIREEARKRECPPIGFGSIWKDAKMTGYQSVLPMPEDVLPSLLTMLLAEKLRFVVLDGAPFVRGNATIRSYTFLAKVNAEDLMRSENDYSSISR